MSTAVDRRYRIGDLSVLLRSDDQPAATAADEMLRYHGIAEPWDEADADITLELSGAAACVSIPDGIQEIATHATGVQILALDDVRFLRRGEVTTRIDLRSGRVSTYLPQQLDPARRGADLYLMLIFSLVILLQERGSYGLHAAALRDANGQGVLIVAESDSGKSTMTMHLVRQGWDYVSDDSVLLSAEGRSVSARSLRRDFAVDPDAVEVFPELAGRVKPLLTDPKKRQLDPDDVFPGQRAASCIPRLLLFPVLVDRPRTELVELGAREAFLLLMRQGSFLSQDPATASAQLAVFQSLVEQAAAFRVEAAADIKEDGRYLSEIISQIVGRRSS